MPRHLGHAFAKVILGTGLCSQAFAQNPQNWAEVRALGRASLLDFLDAPKSCRDIHLNYQNLIGSYLAAANQLNLAVGREVIQ